ncbi:ATP-binding cassette domain-containing protein [Streptosporangium lutulentum]
MSLLDVTGLRVRSADGRELVSDVSFSIDAGTRLGLIGESGSGKSLTTLAIMGLLRRG